MNGRRSDLNQSYALRALSATFVTVLQHCKMFAAKQAGLASQPRRTLQPDGTVLLMARVRGHGRPGSAA